MRKMMKILLIVPCVLLLSACYPFTYLSFIDFIKETADSYAGHLLVHSEKTSTKEAEYVIFYDEYHDEAGMYAEGRINDLYYYTQLVFNDQNQPRSYVRFEVGYSEESVTCDILGILEHNNYKRGSAKVEHAYFHMYDESKSQYLLSYTTLCINTIVDTLIVLETIVNPAMNVTMKDWGFNL